MDNKWQRPNPPYHITSLFVNRKKENMDKDEFKCFKEEVDEEIEIKGIVIVENFLICAIMFPTSIPIENKIPHMTLLLKDGKALDSNMVLERLIFTKNSGTRNLAGEIIQNFYKSKNYSPRIFKFNVDNCKNPEYVGEKDEIREMNFSLPKKRNQRKLW